MKNFEIRTTNILDAIDLDAICVTTNGVVMKNGQLVMGAGVALAFKKKYPRLPLDLGIRVKNSGNQVYCPTPYANPFIISFPTKNDWKDPSDIKLIETSAIQLQHRIDDMLLKKVGLPCPGARNGGLSVEQSLEIISPFLDPSKVVIYVKE